MFSVDFIKKQLLASIHELAVNPALFAKNPVADFSRNRKLGLSRLICFILSFEAGSLKKELLSYFDFSTVSPSASSFCQQRSKLLPEAFKFLLHDFNSAFPFNKNFKGFRLIACDGSSLNIARNPDDKDTCLQARPSAKVHNQLHLNALFDLCCRRYTDILIQTAHKKNETSAMIDLIKRFDGDRNSVFIADRGYESYNIFAHIQEKNMYYLIRVKDIDSNGIVASLKLPFKNEFDYQVNLKLTRNQTKQVISDPMHYKYIPSSNNFDFLPAKEKSSKQVQFYTMNFRVVRFCLDNGNYECVITNLPDDVFQMKELKMIYEMRWGIETSFRELKYSVGLNCFHSKKADFILQEIYARIIMFNFCELIMSCISVPEKDAKYTYKINRTVAIYICRNFLRKDISPPDVVNLILKNLLPEIPGRSFKRKTRFQTWINFGYRIY